MPKATLVTFNCRGFRSDCPRHYNRSLPSSVAALGGVYHKMYVRTDQGLMPPAPRPARLSREAERAIASCDAERRRPLKAVLVANFEQEGLIKNLAHRRRHFGSRGGVRTAYLPFHDPAEGFVIVKRSQLQRLRRLVDGDNRTVLEEPTYDNLLSSAKFALLPRGDAKWSYRFTEAVECRCHFCRLSTIVVVS